MQPSDGFPYYISLTKGISLFHLFESTENIAFISSLSEEKATLRYLEEKWSIKQILGHITDHERIMTYRALRFSRKDATLLPGYDQELLVNNARFDLVPSSMLVQDFVAVRSGTLSFIKMLTDEQLQLKGIAWKFELSVEETLRAIVGHEMHHLKVIKEKYLN